MHICKYVPTDCTVTASFKVDKITISYSTGYEEDRNNDGKYPKPGGGFYEKMYNICLYITASGPADKDYPISAEIYFVNNTFTFALYNSTLLY